MAIMAHPWKHAKMRLEAWEGFPRIKTFCPVSIHDGVIQADIVSSPSMD